MKAATYTFWIAFLFYFSSEKGVSQGRSEGEGGRQPYLKEGAPFDLAESPADEVPDESLPFPLSPSKRLSQEDIRSKREGWYLTGLPEVGVDPIRGFGMGANVFIYNNNDKTDPFFFYTPYRTQIAASARVFSNGMVSGSFNIDAPYAFNTKWRLRGDLIYASDPNWQYFGMGSQTLGPLTYRDRGNPLVFNTARRFSNYSEQQAVVRPGVERPSPGGVFNEQSDQFYTDVHYNELIYNEFLAAVAAERTFFEGRMRLMFGYEFILIGLEHYDGRKVHDAIDPVTGNEVEAINGKTKISEDYAAKIRGDEGSFWDKYNIGGYNGGKIGLLQMGIMWDTRDLEPDPSRGVFIEYAQEISNRFTGSDFNYSKHLAQAVFYQKLFPQTFSRMIWATRFALGGIRGSNIPFTEAFDQWGSSEGAGHPTLGGDRTLRGYRESRFVASMAGWANTELRIRFYENDILNQHLALSMVPFYDVGRVWNDWGDFFSDWSGFRGAPGLGLRIAWNQATILRLDYSYSREDSQFFFVFGHAF